MYLADVNVFACDGCGSQVPVRSTGGDGLPDAPDGWSILNLRFAVCGDACRLKVLRANALRQDPTWTPSTNDPNLMSSLYEEGADDEEPPLDLGVSSPPEKPLLTDRIADGIKKLLEGRK